MALSGTVTTNKYNGNIGLKLTWTGTQSVANNSTTITWTLTSNGGSSGSYWMAGPITVVIGSKTVLNTTSRFKLYGGGAYKKTGSLTINHKADGTQTAWMSVKAAIYTSSVNCTGSNTFTFDKIDRYALITEFGGFNDEQSPTITYVNPQGPEVVTDLKVRVTWNNGTGYTSWYNINDWTGGTYTIHFSSADRELLRAATPTSYSLAVKFDLQSTMDGSEWHDYKNATMEIVNAAPSPGALSYYDSDTDVVAITDDDQVIVQSHSTLVIHAEPSQGTKGATIVERFLMFNGSIYYPDAEGNFTFVKPNMAGTYDAIVVTTDSRGNTARAILDIPILGWTQPSALYSFERVQDFTTNDAILHVDGNISDIPGSTLLITESHREKDTGSWSTPATVPDNTDFTIHNLDYKKDYELIITVSDSFTRADDPQTNTTYTVTIVKGIPLVFFDTWRTSVSVNGFPDGDEQLYVGGTIHAQPNDTNDGVVLPHAYSTTEQIVGYWTDGSPVYEKVVEFQSAVSVSANAWNSSVFTNPDEIFIIDAAAMINTTPGMTNWGFVATQCVNKVIGIFNSRDVAITIDRLILKYTKVT